MKFANKTIQYAIYSKDSGKTVFVEDTASYTRPNLELPTDEVKGSGIMGALSLPTLAQLGALEGSIVFNKTNAKIAELFAPGSHTIEVRWVSDNVDSASGSIGTVACKDIIKFAGTGLNLGSVEGNTTNENTLTMQITYFQHIQDGKSLIEVDKLNTIFKINGVDYAKKIKDSL